MWNVKVLVEEIEEKLMGIIPDRLRMAVWRLKNLPKRESAIRLVQVPDYSVLQVTDNLKTALNTQFQEGMLLVLFFVFLLVCFKGKNININMLQWNKVGFFLYFFSSSLNLQLGFEEEVTGLWGRIGGRKLAVWISNKILPSQFLSLAWHRNVVSNEKWNTLALR